LQIPKRRRVPTSIRVGVQSCRLGLGRGERRQHRAAEREAQGPADEPAGAAATHESELSPRGRSGR
jgi:hypothetical protein